MRIKAVAIRSARKTVTKPFVNVNLVTYSKKMDSNARNVGFT